MSTTVHRFGPAAIVVLLVACGPSSSSQEERDQRAEEYAKSFGVDAKVSTGEDGKTSVTVDRSVGGMTNLAGANLAVPEGFPDDVPVYPELNIVSAAQLPGGGFMVQGQTPHGVDQVAEFYSARMSASGWASETGQQSPGIQVLPFKKGNRTANINLIAGQGTTVQLALMGTP